MQRLSAKRVRLRMDSKEMTLEQAFTELETAIAKLEKEDISLEDSFKTYEEGMKLVQLCNEKITKVEKEVLVLNGNGELNEF